MPKKTIKEIPAAAADSMNGSSDAKREAFALQAYEKLLAANIEISAITSRLANFCKRNCVHCCKHIFSISRTEVTAITLFLLNNPEARESFLNNMAALELEFPDRRELRTSLSTPDKELEYFSRKIPCDFLDSHGDCLIYPVRPLNCSGYIAYAPARICALEPKGHIPPEAHKTYITWRQWFEAEARKRYPGQEVQSYLWPYLIQENLQGADF